MYFPEFFKIASTVFLSIISIKLNTLGKVGKVEEILVKANEELKPGAQILKITGGCTHPTIMKV